MSVVKHTCYLIVSALASDALTDRLVSFCFVFSVGVLFGMRLLGCL
jgi:hypothetical protein